MGLNDDFRDQKNYQKACGNCHNTDKYRITVQSIYNLRRKTPNEILWFFTMGLIMTIISKSRKRLKNFKKLSIKEALNLLATNIKRNF